MGNPAVQITLVDHVLAFLTERAKNKMTITNWEITNPEFDLLVQVADRALAAFTHYPDDKRTLVMDLMACHANACALDFKSMLEGPLQDLSHDIYGIRKHINRDTGKLEDFFTPRYALANHVPEQEAN
jgi:hypothetical protein